MDVGSESAIITRTWSGHTRITVHTTDRALTIKIDEDPICCENFGVESEPADLTEFIGATILKVRAKEGEDDVDCGLFREWAAFDVETDRGKFLLRAFNEHNGYYAHEFLLTWGREIVHRGWLYEAVDMEKVKEKLEALRVSGESNENAVGFNPDE